METIRGVVQPITKNLPPPIRELGLSLLGGKCYQRIILDVDFTDQECLKFAVSKALGTGIVAMSAIVKLPQLISIVSSESAEGISFLSYLLETASYVITLAYNARMGNPFSTYGEVALIAVQNIAISGLVLRYSNRSGEAGIFVFGLALGTWLLFQSDFVDMNLLSLLQAGAGGLGVASKLPQIYEIWKEGTTGQLSTFAVCLQIHTSRRITLIRMLGIQLPSRISFTYFYNIPRSQRPRSPLRIYCWIRPQPCPCSSSLVLLERSIKDTKKGSHHSRTEREGRVCCTQFWI